MDGVLIATTGNADLQALGTGGQLAVHSWEQITGYLSRRHGPAHAALLAEPNPDPARGVTEWYTEGEGPAPPLDHLPAAEQDAARAEFTQLFNDIRADIAVLRGSQREDERFLAELLSLALITPATDCLRVINGRPVLIAWAHAPIGAAASPELLIGQLAGRAAPATRTGPMRILGPPPVVQKPSRGLLRLPALLLVLPLVLLALLLIDPFRWFVAVPPVCVIDQGGVALLDDLRQEEARENTLRDQIARVMLDLGDRRVICPPARAQAPEQSLPERSAQRLQPLPQPIQDQTPEADVKRATDQGGQKGKIQIVLAWDDANDLDLSVVCPDGTRIFFNNQRGCGGELDLDQNLATPVPRPVENIVFPEDPAPGTYRVEIANNQHRAPSPPTSPFRVTVRQDGVPDKVFTGTVTNGRVVRAGEFTVPAR